MPRFNCQHAATLHLILTNPAAREASIAALVVARAPVRLRRDQPRLRGRLRGPTATALTAYARGSGRAAARGREGSCRSRCRRSSTASTTARNRLLRLPGAGEGRGLRVRHELGLALDDLRARLAGRRCRTCKRSPTTRPRCRTRALRAGRAAVRDGLARGRGPSHPATALHHAEVMQLVARYGRGRAGPDGVLVDVQVHRPAGVAHEVWFSDRTTIAARMQVAKERGLGLRRLAPGPGGPGRLGRPADRAGQLAALGASASSQFAVRRFAVVQYGCQLPDLLTRRRRPFQTPHSYEFALLRVSLRRTSRLTRHDGHGNRLGHRLIPVRGAPPGAGTGAGAGVRGGARTRLRRAADQHRAGGRRE